MTDMILTWAEGFNSFPHLSICLSAHSLSLSQGQALDWKGMPVHVWIFM